ncbi:hypothetical protein C7212DRAFT_338672, partial [Tuber magnatum]
MLFYSTSFLTLPRRLLPVIINRCTRFPDILPWCIADQVKGVNVINAWLQKDAKIYR